MRIGKVERAKTYKNRYVYLRCLPIFTDQELLTVYLFGLKLHTLTFRRQETIPFPEMIILSSAEESGLTVLKREVADDLINRDIFKIYSGFSF